MEVNELDQWRDDLLSILDPGALNAQKRIVSSTFENIDEEIRGRIVGDGESDWSDFLRQANANLEQLYGLKVRSIPGGGIEPQALEIPEKIGTQLAKELWQKSVTQEDDVRPLLGQRIHPLDQRMLDLFRIDIQNPQSWLDKFRDGFKSPLPGKNRKYKFLPGGSFGFRITKEEISFYYSEKVLERKLVSEKPNKLVNRIGNLWNIEIECRGNEGKTRAGRLGNSDITLVGKRRLVTGHELQIAALEVKKDNKIESIFKALSQAASYRALANEVWIVAPGLREHEFSSSSQHNSFIKQCQENGFGVLTLDLDDSNKSVAGIHILLRARSSPVIDTSLQRRLLAQLEWRYCHKCSHFYADGVSDDADGVTDQAELDNDCGWVVTGPSGEFCARELEERLLLGALPRSTEEQSQ